MLVAIEKKPTTLQIPVPLIGVLNQMSEGVGAKRKWMVVSACIIALARMPKDERDRLIDEAGAADLPGRSWDDLVASLNLMPAGAASDRGGAKKSARPPVKNVLSEISPPPDPLNQRRQPGARDERKPANGK